MNENTRQRNSLLQKQADLVAEQKAIFTRLEREGRAELTDAERARDDEINVALDLVAADLERAERQRRNEAKVRAPLPPAAPAVTLEDYEHALRMPLTRARADFWRSSQAARDEASVVANYLRGKRGAEADLQEYHQQLMAASNDTDMNIGTPADGGYAVPTGHYRGIIARSDESRLDNRLGVMPIPGVGTTVNVPTEGGNAELFVLTTETNTFDRDAPVLGQAQMTLAKYTKNVELSVELLEDEDSRLMAFLDIYVGRAHARTLNSLLITALAAGATVHSLASASAIAATEIPGIVYALKEPYAENANWVMKRSTEGAIRALSGNNWQFMNTPAGTVESRLWGFTTYNCEFAAAPAANAKSLYFGDFSYVGRREGALTFLRNPYLLGSKGQVVLHYYLRVIYKVLNSEAILVGTHPSA